MPDNEEGQSAQQNARELKKLKTRRSQLKSTLTRFRGYVNSSDLNITTLKLRLNNLNAAWTEFQSIQSELEELDPVQANERETFEDEYYNYASIAMDHIEQHDRIVLQSQNTCTNTNTNISQSNPSSTSNNVKLQSISLPQFSGSYEGWLQFFEIFQALVDKDTNLTKIQKFYYLQSCLHGEAIQCLQSLEICETNYDVAIKLLRERYENKRVLIHNHTRNLFEMPSIAKESHHALRKLIDNVARNTRALSSLNQPVDKWDTMLIYLISQKIDNQTRKEWEIFNKVDSPTFDDFLNFLKNKCQVLETIHNKSQNSQEYPIEKYASRSSRNMLNHLNANEPSSFSQNSSQNPIQFSKMYCSFCTENTHYAYKCPNLIALPVKERYAELKRKGICTNCLRKGHSVDGCTGKSCRTCNRKHNSILHDYNFINKRNHSTITTVTRTNQNIDNNFHLSESSHPSQSGNPTSESSTTTPIVRTTELPSLNACSYETPLLAPNSRKQSEFQTQNQLNDYQILLATALVYVLDNNNRPIECRALLDSASQSNFCSENFYRKLNIPSNKINLPVLGINNTKSKVSSKIKASLKAINSSFQATTEFLIVDKITSNLPQISFDSKLLQIPNNIDLADPEFAYSRHIDILIGTELFFTCLNNGQISFGRNAPMLQNTKFGWVIVGPLHFNKWQKQIPEQVNCFLTINNDNDKILHDTVQKFWQLENIENSQNRFNNEELECELYFRENYKIDSEGRYVVKLPLKENHVKLGESYNIACKCLNSLERRLDRNPELRKKYSEFLEEYENLGHMSRINPDLDQANKIYVYLSHHAVIKESSSTTKVRVVFNASQKTGSGLSLNDVLKIGPKVQRDVFDIVFQMRIYPILITADIEKMYRMILIDESQRNLQRILWRDNETKAICHFQLNTITYGTASASFLATRVLHEIGLKHKISNPEASQIIINNFYMDDLIFGHHDINKAIFLKNELNEILSKSGFNLRKWNSNDERIIHKSDDIPDNTFYIKTESESKTLGTFWNPVSDTIAYQFKLKFDVLKITKRNVLATIGQLFDILGLISPVIVKAKLILQEIWKLKIDWDTEVPENISIRWLEFVKKLNDLDLLQIPRCVLNSSPEKGSIILCGFCDASQMAYGACVYLVHRNHNSEIESNLICSKSRLAPLSSTTLPRLELCGALLLAQLINRVTNSLKITINVTEIVLFTDSTIVIDWLNSESSKWKIFVSNRVAEIQRLTENIVWQHIDTQNNPADIVSRGAHPEDLYKQSLWWYGPSFLKTNRECWPKSQNNIRISVHEARKENINLSFANLKQNPNILMEIVSKFSSYSKLLHVISYIYRFIKIIRTKNKILGSLTAQELDGAVLKICKQIQFECFSDEIKSLRNNKKLLPQSRLVSLNPFFDKSEVVRVGGRLTNANLNFDRKHPIILPSKHRFTELLINHYHHKFLHAGPRFILNQIREKFWIICGRTEVRKILRKCITCFRVKPLNINQIMGSLPAPRVLPSRPFSYCGIDYAGPYLLKDGKTRNRVLIKAYVCVFICFSSRAVHAELVTDLSSEAFLNAFKRFVSRRGLSSHVFSDNATNFVGSNNEMKRLCQVVLDTVNNKYQNYFADHKIQWHFIPTRSPHHGGIWESAVRSFKYHLKRVLGENHLNFEHFYTLLTQIEAILNSRPILPLTDDPEDLEILTPGHFLIGESMVAVPQSEDIDIPTNRLRYYQKLQQILQRFWSLWSKDYLNTLQQRSKWRTQQDNIKLDTLVLLKEDNEPPMHWPLGRVLAVHPGKDKNVRVVSVRTKSGVVKRAITKICPLPINDEY